MPAILQLTGLVTVNAPVTKMKMLPKPVLIVMVIVVLLLVP